MFNLFFELILPLCCVIYSQRVCGPTCPPPRLTNPLSTWISPCIPWRTRHHNLVAFWLLLLLYCAFVQRLRSPRNSFFECPAGGGFGWVRWIGGADYGPKPPPFMKGVKRQQLISNRSFTGGWWLMRERRLPHGQNSRWRWMTRACGGWQSGRDERLDWRITEG